jgi:hypothetical protein
LAGLTIPIHEHPHPLSLVAHHAQSARWEQAFSADGGKIWETNWIMEFVRNK